MCLQYELKECLEKLQTLEIKDLASNPAHEAHQLKNPELWSLKCPEGLQGN